MLKLKPSDFLKKVLNIRIAKKKGITGNIKNHFYGHYN
jgi:hypothetical protein